MRRTTFGTLAAITGLVAGCGSGTHYANKPRPATPIDLTVYVNNSRVSISPTSVGAGEVIFIVTNQSDKAEAVDVHHQGETTRLATTGPINPQATAQVTVDLKTGDYTVGTSVGGSEEAIATAPKIQSASLHIGRPRSSSSNVLLQP